MTGLKTGHQVTPNEQECQYCEVISKEGRVLKYLTISADIFMHPFDETHSQIDNE